MASSGGSFSIVEYFGENEGYRCGYCKSSSSNFSHGLWAHSMTVQDYQSLVDRGWRRSGQHVYKPTMHLICCPMYTIRCSALDFKPTKSQKKILKRVHHFLATGERRSDKSDNTSMSSDVDSDHGFQTVHEIPHELKERVEKAVTDVSNAEVKSVDISLQKSQGEGAVTEVEGIGSRSKTNPDVKIDTAETNKSSDSIELRVPGDSGESSMNLKKAIKTGTGADSSRPACKKAKILRLERKKQKLQSQGLSEEDVIKRLGEKALPTEKSLEDFINEPLPANPAHRLEIRLVNSNQANSEFEATFNAAFEVYQKYQMVIHGDPPSKCTERQFTRFLVTSPLKTVLVSSGSPEMAHTLPSSWDLFVKYQMKIHKETPEECDYGSFLDFLVNTPLKFERSGNSPPCGYGSFHQQYWLDNQLIAVGVIDILPNCVSSVYFYYDPDYSDLSLGTYASLREMSFTRSLHYHASSIKYYYMGFYIDSCPKMRYKGRLKPSFLLCPETYSWHPFDEAHKKLQKSKYSRLNDDKAAADSDGHVDVDKVLVLYNNTCMDFKTYKSRKSRCTAGEIDQVKQYASLIGMKCAKRLLLYRSGSL